MHKIRNTVPVFALGLVFLTSCGIDENASLPAGEADEAAQIEPQGVWENGAYVVHSQGAHILPVVSKRGERAERAPATVKMNYYGGPVLASVNVVEFMWTSTVYDGTQLGMFYQDIVQSVYMDWLDEYNTPTQSIGRGTYGGSFTDPSPPTSTNLTDTQVESEINKRIADGTLPAPTANTLYMTHFPSGTVITMPSGTSCVDFCAYHSTFTRNGSNIYYSVIPDHSRANGCGNGCGNGTQLQLTTVSASHELTEAITDAAVGLARSYAAPMAWNDPNNGEVGDVCIQPTDVATIDTWMVQTEWSNQEDRCIAMRAASGNDFTLSATPSTRTVTAGTAGSFNINTTVSLGSPGDISLSATGLPSGATATFSPASVAAGSTSTLKITTAATTPNGTTKITINGNGGGTTHTTSIMLTVTGSSSGTPDAGGPTPDAHPAGTPDAAPAAPDAHPVVTPDAAPAVVPDAAVADKPDARPHPDAGDVVTTDPSGGCSCAVGNGHTSRIPGFLGLLGMIGLAGAARRRSRRN